MSRPLRVGYILLGCLLGTTLAFILLSKPSGVDSLKVLLLRYEFDAALADWFWFPAVAGGGAGAILGLIYGVIQDVREARDAQHEGAFREAAAQTIGSGSQGLSAAAAAPACVGLKENAAEFFRQVRDLEVRWELPAPMQDIRFTVADLALSRQYERDGRTEVRTELQTIAFYESGELRFPGFNLNPRGLLLNVLARVFGTADIHFPAHEEFSRAYHLSASVPENTRRLFDYAPLLDALGRRPGLKIASQVNALIVYREGKAFHGAPLQGFMEEAAEILRLFEQAARNAGVIAANAPAAKVDARALADSATGLMGTIARAGLVTHADVDAFLLQPAPRNIPAGMRRYPDRFVSAYIVVLASVFFVAGAFFLLLNVRALMSQETNNPAGVPLGLIFMIVGGSIAYFAGRIRWRCRRLLRHGRIASGQVQYIEPTSYAIGSDAVHEVTVTYPSEAGSVRGSCNILGLPSLRRARVLLRDKKPARILYDPAHPERILLAEALLNVSEEIEP